METVSDFIFLGSKITVDSDCGHEIKRHLHLRRKAMTHLDSVWKSRVITSWQIDGETMKTVRDFIFLGSKITVDGD